MKIADYFRIALCRYFEVAPRGTQAVIADKFKISKSNLSDFLKGRKPLSEEKRAKISEHLGFNYESMVAVGRKMYHYENSSNQKNLKLIDAQIDTSLLVKIRKKYGFSIKDFADWIGISDTEYIFKEKKFFPFTFSEISIIFRNITEIEPTFKNPLEKRGKKLMYLCEQINKMPLDEKKALITMLKNEKEQEEKNS